MYISFLDAFKTIIISILTTEDNLLLFIDQPGITEILVYTRRVSRWGPLVNPVDRAGAGFSKAPETLPARKAKAKSQTL